MPAKAALLLALAVALAAASNGIEPYLRWRSYSKRKSFCARAVAGRMGEASQLIPEDSRTAFIHDAKDIPASCAPDERDRVVLKYQDGRLKTLAFSYERTRWAPWRHARLASVQAVVP